jgi:hypothetical protein
LESLLLAIEIVFLVFGLNFESQLLSSDGKTSLLVIECLLLIGAVGVTGFVALKMFKRRSKSPVVPFDNLIAPKRDEIL